MKRCSKCEEQKSLSEFYKDRDKLRSECKVCTRTARQARYDADPEHGRAINQKYRQTERGQLTHRRLNKERAQTEDFKAYQREWVKTEKGMAARRGRVNRYEKTELGRAAAKRRRNARRAREREIENTLTAGEWQDILSYYGNTCVYCGIDFSAVPPTQDHVIPISRGGHNIRENVVPACRPCNSRKGNRVSA
jgi:5-methylcytosine-specific restriction endonuclease McrA